MIDTEVKPLGVMQLMDTLDAGGAERMAVTIANLLPPANYRSFLCATRRGGMLAEDVASHVSLLQLERKRRFDFAELLRLARVIRKQDIRILHAHSTSLFTAVMVARFVPSVKVIWHDHYGKRVEQPATPVYRLCIKAVHHIVVVSSDLQNWAQKQFALPLNKVTYLPNFVLQSDESQPKSSNLPGSEGARIVCLANIRPVKDQLNLLRAMRKVVDAVPQSHLLLVGSLVDTAYVEQVRDRIDALELQNNVSLLGQRKDIGSLLHSVDIGVLSSASEGLPLALLEYGAAGLPVVTTDVGQCADVLDGGKAGIVVPPADPEALANALIALLHSPELRRSYGAKFQSRVQTFYSPEAGMLRLQKIYTQVL